MLDTISIPVDNGTFKMSFNAEEVYLFVNEMEIVKREYNCNQYERDLVGTLIDIYTDINYRLIATTNNTIRSLLLSGVIGAIHRLGGKKRLDDTMRSGMAKKGTRPFVFNGIPCTLRFALFVDPTRVYGTANYHLRFTTHNVTLSEKVQFNWLDGIPPLNVTACKLYERATQQLANLQAEIFEAQRGLN